MQTSQLHDEESSAVDHKETASGPKESSSLLTSDLKLNLVETYPNSLDELEIFLTTKCTLNSSGAKVSSKSFSP